MTSTPSDKNPQAYDQSPVCPRCGSDWPCCADINPKTGGLYLHEATCDQYNWSDNVCESCKSAKTMKAEKVNLTSGESVPLLLNQILADASWRREKPKKSYCRFFQCETGRSCVAWTIPLVILAIAMWVATGLIVKHVGSTAADDNYGTALIPMVILTLVVTCATMYPWFELILANKERIAREQAARNP